MTHPAMVAQLITATGWTLQQIGELTPRQLHTLWPELARASSGDEEPQGKLSYAEACRIAGVENRIKDMPPQVVVPERPQRRKR